MSALASTIALPLSEPSGQGWKQVAEFALAFLLSGAIGLEREIRQKSAGLRTYTVVGLGAALFTLVSKYGFTDVLASGTVVLDPSRVAAQIVSGLGFIGAGVIFTHRGSVRGLTTAASIWLTAAIGAACAAGLPVLAVLATAAYFLVAYAARPLAHLLPVLSETYTTYRITYADGSGLLRELARLCTEAGFSIGELTTLGAGLPPDIGSEEGDASGAASNLVQGRAVQVSITIHGRGDIDALTTQLAAISGVYSCTISEAGDE
jgi:putative Mg2+ transporter-C (MgtC) family protein